jgi:hypothetical protein
MAETAVKPNPAELWAEAKLLDAVEFFGPDFLVTVTARKPTIAKILTAVRKAVGTSPEKRTVEKFTAEHVIFAGGRLGVRNLDGVSGKTARSFLELLLKAGYTHPDLPKPLSPEARSFLNKLNGRE